MGKAINSFVGKSADNDSRVIKLSIIDFFNPNGVREKTVVKQKNRDPQVKVVTEVREVTYIYDKKTSKGYEIVKEVSVSRDNPCAFVAIDVKVVDEIVRDLRTPGYVEKPVRENREEY